MSLLTGLHSLTLKCTYSLYKPSFCSCWLHLTLYIPVPGEEHDNPLQYSCLENPMDREAWQATVHGVAKSRTHSGNLAFMHTCTISFYQQGLPRVHTRTRSWIPPLDWKLIKDFFRALYNKLKTISGQNNEAFNKVSSRVSNSKL